MMMFQSRRKLEILDLKILLNIEKVMKYLFIMNNLIIIKEKIEKLNHIEQITITIMILMVNNNMMVDYMNKFLTLTEMYIEINMKVMDITQVINTMNIVVVIILKIITLNI